MVGVGPLMKSSMLRYISINKEKVMNDPQADWEDTAYAYRKMFDEDPPEDMTVEEMEERIWGSNPFSKGYDND
jgi:hypothetical protein